MGGRAARELPQAERAASVTVAGHRFLADRSGVLFCPESATLIVADLHFEKGSAFASRGWMLPPYDTRETLKRLAEAIDVYRPSTIVALGDSLHDRRAIDRFGEADRAALAALQAGRRWIWITGNHDREIPDRLAGETSAEWVIAGLRLRHEPTAGETTGEIAGHLHPAARLASPGLSIRRPCFITDGQRLIVPAFGAFTGGLNVLDEACLGLFAADRVRIVMLGDMAAYPVPIGRLIGD